jgi:pimeloyl-ACP methyl ester carboxylesterase
MTGAEPDTRFAEVTGDRFAYRRAGPRGERPLLMCHRFRGTIDDWDPAFLDPLTVERDVVVFDNRGVGHSTGSVPPTVSGTAADALLFADAIGLDCFDVLGWSMGGFVAQAIALDAPDRVARLIVAASKPGPVPDAPQTSPEVSQVAGKPVNDEEDFLYLSSSHRASGVAPRVWRRFGVSTREWPTCGQRSTPTAHRRRHRR